MLEGSRTVWGSWWEWSFRNHFILWSWQRRVYQAGVCRSLSSVGKTQWTIETCHLKEPKVSHITSWWWNIMVSLLFCVRVRESLIILRKVFLGLSFVYHVLLCSLFFKKINIWNFFYSALNSWFFKDFFFLRATYPFESLSCLRKIQIYT